MINNPALFVIKSMSPGEISGTGNILEAKTDYKVIPIIKAYDMIEIIKDILFQ
ncbi:MAG: hypothetical protein ACYCTB_10600 [bacterium]